MVRAAKRGGVHSIKSNHGHMMIHHDRVILSYFNCLDPPQTAGSEIFLVEIGIF